MNNKHKCGLELVRMSVSFKKVRLSLFSCLIYEMIFFFQIKNAYKYWEVRENTEMIVEAIADWIKEEIDAEISDLKATLLNLKKSTVTVYDPKNGEIQVELHLPFPVKSLQALPVIDVTPFSTKLKSYRPFIPSLSLPSADVTSWIPPFDGKEKQII